MIITVSEFIRITGEKKNSVYSWIYRNRLNERGIELYQKPGISSVGKKTQSRLFKIRKTSEHYDKLKKEFV